MQLKAVPSGLLAATALLLGYATAFQSMAATWWTSDTFAHGMLVFPISAWLAWSQRERLRGVLPSGSMAGVALVLMLGGLWLVARLAAIQVVQQFAVVMLVPAAVWALFGRDVLSAMLFPLGFLLFAVPFGEALIPHLMEFTATFTVAALQLIGMPVLRDGLYFSVPSGDFEVAKACSGIRYLIASIALGVLFAYLTFRSTTRRLLFVAAAVIVPIIANGLRALGIVLLAHYSDRKLAVGVDHLIYGWLFFGIVMFALFWVGSLFREDDDAVAGEAASQLPALAALMVPGTRVAGVVCALLVAPLVFLGLQAADARVASNAHVAMPLAGGVWQGPEPVSDDKWQTQFEGASGSLAGEYAGDNSAVTLRIEHYDRQSQGAELINDLNRVYDTVYWSRLTRESDELTLGNGSILFVNSERVRHDNDTRLIWYWYRVGQTSETGAAAVKLRELWQRLTLRGSSATLVAVGTPEDGDSTAARERLAAFVQQHVETLHGCLATGVTNAGCAP
ncbi:MAG: exosortase A [Pseudomonadota bacterium]